MAQGKTTYTFGGVAPITCHAFSAQGDKVALSKNNKEVEVSG